MLHNLAGAERVSSDDPSCSGPRVAALPRILIVDHFDSYTLNILSLLSSIATNPEELDERIVVLAHTHPLLSSQDSFRREVLPHFDAVILSPGPGSPDRAADFGFGLDYLRKAAEYQLPTLGVCLGHQGLAVAFGGSVKRALSIQHGRVSSLLFPDNDSQGQGLFAGISSGSKVTRYNSLTVELSNLPDCLEVTAVADDLPNSVPVPAASDLIRSRAASPALIAATERCILGLSHKELPLWGVQFHPESIESDQGAQMLYNFISLAEHWHAIRAPAKPPTASHIPPSIRRAGERNVAAGVTHRESPLLNTQSQAKATKPKLFRLLEHTFAASQQAQPMAPQTVFERLFRRGNGQSAIWLDSARVGDPQSNCSYMCRPSFQVSYCRLSSQDRAMIYSAETNLWSRQPLPAGMTFWSFVDAIQKDVQRSTEIPAKTEPCRNTFRGGFVGYWGYEMKDESLGLQVEETLSRGRSHKDPPDSEFAFCPAVLQFDHVTSNWSASMLVRQCGDDDSASELNEALQQLENKVGHKIGLTAKEARHWLDAAQTALCADADSLSGSVTPPSASPDILPPLRPLDDELDYSLKVEAARALISQGESYELCLTTQFIGELPEARNDYSDHFDLYQALRNRNPAPYAAYIQLPDLPPNWGGGQRGRAILSSSPERFLSQTKDGAVEMKPIKGTVPRAGYGRGEDSLLAYHGADWIQSEDARRCKALEADIKERAENLMIVDLIRADLLSFCYPQSVVVPKLMKVESYQSVHQLVTTVRGQAKAGVSPVEAVQRCFPPGSMTGAPKRRSVTLLERLEGKRRLPKTTQSPHCAETEQTRSWSLRHRPRGPYSGALGWIGFDGASDFSVVIRTAVIADQQVTIGAGGAITYLSDAGKEWVEVLHKVEALARVSLSDERAAV
ncbi:unnamed protein product [Parajaminaea phylloscopi]